jgi:hypothetical protein
VPPIREREEVCTHVEGKKVTKLESKKVRKLESKKVDRQRCTGAPYKRERLGVHARKAHKSQSSLSWKFQRAQKRTSRKVLCRGSFNARKSAQVAKFSVVEVSTRTRFFCRGAFNAPAALAAALALTLTQRRFSTAPRAHTNPPHPGHGHADGRAGGPPAARTRRLRAGATAPIRALVRGTRRELIGARALYERASSHVLTRSSLRRRRRALAAASAAALALATAAQRARAGRPGVPRPTPTSRCCAPSGPPRATRPPTPKVPRPRRPPRARPPRALISVLILLI